MATRRPAKGEQHLLAGGVPPPLAQPDYIESRGGDQMLEIGSGQPEVAASAQDTAQATIYALATIGFEWWQAPRAQRAATLSKSTGSG
jgi:hypothetical protein